MHATALTYKSNSNIGAITNSTSLRTKLYCSNEFLNSQKSTTHFSKSILSYIKNKFNTDDSRPCSAFIIIIWQAKSQTPIQTFKKADK